MKTRSNQLGVTLVELLVASVVSLVIGGVMYAIFFMYSNQSGSTISSLLLQQQYDNVSQQIGRDVRKSVYVLPEGETPATRGAGYDSVASICLWDASGAVLAHYKIDNGLLLEGSGQTPFTAGGGQVHLDSDDSYFIVTPQRNGIGLNLVLSKTSGRAVQNLSARKDVFLCRN